MAKAKPITEQEISKMMALVQCSREDAIDIIESDREIDKGNDAWFENPEDKAKMKEALKQAHKGDKAPRKPMVLDKKPRERKPNELKGNIIAMLAEFLETQVDTVNVVNKEREIAFTVGEIDFSVTLTQHRKPKA